MGKLISTVLLSPCPPGLHRTDGVMETQGTWRFLQQRESSALRGDWRCSGSVWEMAGSVQTLGQSGRSLRLEEVSPCLGRVGEAYEVSVFVYCTGGSSEHVEYSGRKPSRQRLCKFIQYERGIRDDHMYQPSFVTHCISPRVCALSLETAIL